MRKQKGAPDRRRLVAGDGEWRISAYTPTVFSPFAVNMEKLTIRRRARFFIEGLSGYTVYYLSVGGALAGYCVVARGDSARYGFSGASDILVGPIFIAEAFRGRRLSILLLQETLSLHQGRFESAYAYIKKSNAPSLAAFEAAGFARYREAAVSRVLHRVYAAENGKFILMKREGAPDGKGEHRYSDL